MNMLDSLSQFGPLKLLNPMSIISEIVTLDLKAECHVGSTDGHLTYCKTGTVIYDPTK